MSKKLDPKFQKKKKFEVHLITLGDSAVGKTSLISRYNGDTFKSYYVSTHGVDSQYKKIKLQNGEEINVKITDTAGQERYRSIAQNYIKKANGILLVYDITNKESFQNVFMWGKEIKDKSEDSKPIILIGNKMDLEDKRCVSKEEGEELAGNYCDGGIRFYETSCKTGENVNEAIDDLVNLVYNKYSGNNINEENNIKIDGKQRENGTRCCK